MRTMRKAGLFILAILVFLTLFLVSSCAEVTGVRDIGDGSAEITWDDASPATLVIIPKMSENSNDDVAAFGIVRTEDVTGMRKAVCYYMAPGQSYWLVMINTDGVWSAPYAYNAYDAPNFNEWRTAPHFSSFSLKRKNANGKYDNLDYFQYGEISDRNNLNNNGYGLCYIIEWPVLKEARFYHWQTVFTDPYGCKIVFNSEFGELPRGKAWLDWSFYPIENYFKFLQDTRNDIPIGDYQFSLFWDGYRVCTETFRVR